MTFMTHLYRLSPSVAALQRITHHLVGAAEQRGRNGEAISLKMPSD
jgi:hypothetical protein